MSDVIQAVGYPANIQEILNSFGNELSHATGEGDAIVYGMIAMQQIAATGYNDLKSIQGTLSEIKNEKLAQVLNQHQR